MVKNIITSYDVSEKEPMLADANNVAAQLLAAKNIRVGATSETLGYAVRQPDADDTTPDEESDDEASGVPAPNISDILVKNSAGSYVQVQTGAQYGKLYVDGKTKKVELDFKVMIPDELFQLGKVSVEILSKNEVLATL
jgi:hypothetical protein